MMLSNNTGCFFVMWCQEEVQILQISILPQAGQMPFCMTVAGEKLDDKLWNAVAPLLLLSHGERLFNRQIEVKNMKKGTYSAQRLVCDHLRSVGVVDNVVVTKALLKSASSARQRYLYHLEEQKKKKATETLHTKRKELFDEIDKLKRKKTRHEKDASCLQQSADEFALKAEDLGNLTEISKSNSLRQSAKTKHEQIKN